MAPGPIGRWVDKEVVVRLHNAISFGHKKKKKKIIVCNSMDEPGGYYARWMEPEKRQMLYDLTYIWNLMNKMHWQIKGMYTGNRRTALRGGGGEGALDERRWKDQPKTITHNWWAQTLCAEGLKKEGVGVVEVGKGFCNSVDNKNKVNKVKIFKELAVNSKLIPAGQMLSAHHWENTAERHASLLWGSLQCGCWESKIGTSGLFNILLWI